MAPLHPLPNRPTTLPPRNLNLPQPALAIPRSPFFSAPQPASPRPPGSPFVPGSSPKYPAGGRADKDKDAGTPTVEEPVAWTKKPITKEELKTNCELLELGEGWKVHWRTWHGPALVPSPNPAAPADRASTTPARTADGPPPKKARMSAFDELMADQLASAAKSSPTASTSAAVAVAAPPLKDQLQSLQLVSPASDPIEKARLDVLQRAQSSDSTRRLFALFAHVKVASPRAEDVKGKGKAKEEPGGDAVRALWVFSVTKGRDPTAPSLDEDEGVARAALKGLNFEGLSCVGNGHFSHRDLFPALYPTVAPDPSTSAAPHAPSPFMLPSDLKANNFPSAISLSSELHSDLSPPQASPSRTRGPYEAFVAGATETLLVTLLAEPPPSSTKHSQPLVSRLGDCVVFLPTASEPFGAAGSRIVARAVQTSFRITLQRHGIFIQSTVNDIALRPYPLLLPPRQDSPVLLAPFGTPASFVKAFPPTGASESSIYATWKNVLEGVGVTLAPEETWLLCRVDLPPTSLDDPVSDSVEVVWPASLCLLDGTRPQPRPTPQSTPPRPKAPGLPASPADAGPARAVRSPTLALAPFDIVTRRRFASVLRRTPSNSGTFTQYRDPIGSRAEKVGQMLEEMAEQRAMKEREEREAEALAAAAPTPVDHKHTPTGSSSVTILAGAPINMRTPLSLGGSSTEAPSPADGFQSSERQMGGFFPVLPVERIAKNPEVDQLYPSPPDATNAGLPQHPPTDVYQPMETGFGDFDWGEDFNSNRMQSSMPHDFDDGMGLMMGGLTDDDFSFFDEPAPVSTLPTIYGGLQSSGPSPKFVDHFSHLTGGTPFASIASPVSPFAHTSPHVHHSPGIMGFSFDSHLPINSLGLGAGTPCAQTMGPDTSPFKTPRTPYSPFVDVSDDHDPYTFVPPTLSIAGTPATGLASSQRPSRASVFETVPFGASHAASDDKYDPRKGKFGLPSPEYDANDLAVDIAYTNNPKRPLASAPWYSTVCDPRVTAAVELRRRRTPSLAKIKPKSALSISESSGRARARTWVRTDVESDHCGEDESEDDEMDVDDASELGMSDESLSTAEAGTNLDLSFGPSLVLLRQHLAVLLARVPQPVLVATQPSKATATADSSLDVIATMFGDQVIYNPDFRARTADALLLRPSALSSARLVSAYAINLVSERLSKFSTRHRIASHATVAGAEPLTAQVAPAILLRAQQTVMEMCTSAVRFWKPMAFEPLSGSKDVTAFAVYEEGGEELNSAVKGWLHRVAEAYRASRLGEHTPGAVGTIENGLAIVPAGSLSRAGIKNDIRNLCTMVAEAARSSKHVVVYLLTPPGPLPTSPSSPIALTVQQLLRTRSGPLSTLVYPVPLSTITNPRTMFLGDSSAAQLDRLAFAVFDQLLLPVAKLKFPVPETFPSAPFAHSTGPAVRMFQFPAVTLSPARKPQIEFELGWPASSLEVLHRHRLLHVGYTSIPVEGQPNLEWLVATCIDEKGELWKMSPKLVRCPAAVATEYTRVKVVFAMVRSIADATDLEWRVVICRLGTMSKDEMKAWHKMLKEYMAQTTRPIHVTVACSDLQPPLSVVQLPPDVLCTTSGSPTSRDTDAEEGEVTRIAPAGTTVALRSPHLEDQPSVFAFTPSEPIAIGPSSNLIAPCSTYLIHVPRIVSLAHTLDVDPLLVPPAPTAAISILGLHLLSAHASPSSALRITLEQHLADVRQSFAELSTLGNVRWGTSGRVPWHLEAVATVAELLGEVRS